MLTLSKQEDEKDKTWMLRKTIKMSNSTSRPIDQMKWFEWFAFICTGIMCIGLNAIVLSMLVRLILRFI